MNVHEYRPRIPSPVRNLLRELLGTCPLCGTDRAAIYYSSKSGRSVTMRCRVCNLPWNVTLHQTVAATKRLAEQRPDDVAQRRAEHVARLLTPPREARTRT